MGLVLSKNFFEGAARHIRARCDSPRTFSFMHLEGRRWNLLFASLRGYVLDFDVLETFVGRRHTSCGHGDTWNVHLRRRGKDVSSGEEDSSLEVADISESHTFFIWAGSSFRAPFHEHPRGAPAHLIERRLTRVRRVMLISQLEGGWRGAEQASTGQDLDFGEQDEQTTSPSEQICGRRWVEQGHFKQIYQGLMHIDLTYGNRIAENIFANRARQGVAWGLQETSLL